MKKFFEKVIIFFSWSSSLLITGSVAVLIGFLIKQGIKNIDLELIFGTTTIWDAITFRKQVFDGLFPALIGTFLVVACSVSMAIPIGIAGGIYMAEYAKGRGKAWFSLFLDILAGIPSILIGLAGLSLTIFLHRMFPGKISTSLLISSISLALLVLPYIIRSVQTALEGVDPMTRIIAPSLGASRIDNIFKVLIPNSIQDIVGGIILAVGRCAEDTAVIMLTGAVAVAGIPKNILSQYEALPFYIYYISSQYSSPEELARGYGATILLLIVCTSLLISALWIQKRLTTILLYK